MMVIVLEVTKLAIQMQLFNKLIKISKFYNGESF